MSHPYPVRKKIALPRTLSLRTQTYFRLSVVSAKIFRRNQWQPEIRLRSQANVASNCQLCVEFRITCFIECVFYFSRNDRILYALREYYIISASRRMAGEFYLLFFFHSCFTEQWCNFLSDSISNARVKQRPNPEQKAISERPISFENIKVLVINYDLKWWSYLSRGVGIKCNARVHVI